MARQAARKGKKPATPDDETAQRTLAVVTPLQQKGFKVKELRDEAEAAWARYEAKLDDLRASMLHEKQTMIVCGRIVYEVEHLAPKVKMNGYTKPAGD